MRSRALTLLGIALLVSAASAQTTPARKPPQPKAAPPSAPLLMPPAGGGYLGGADDCSTGPTAIGGQGLFPFDTTNATAGTEGQGEPACLAFGTTGIAHDVWYCWTADASGTAILQTCGLTAVDTKIAAYDGCGCPSAPALACNDDACNLQTTLLFDVVSASTYTLQVGTFPGAAGGTGSFDLSIFPSSGTGSDDCATPDPIAGDGGFFFDNVGATTGSEGQNESQCFAFGTSGIASDVWFEWTAGCSGEVTLQTCGSAANDTKLAAYPGGGCPADGTSLACNDDACALQSRIVWSAAAGATYMLQLGSYPGGSTGVGSFELATVCDDLGPGTALCPGDGSGATPCPCGNSGGAGAGCANSSGSGSTLAGSGSNSIALGDLVLAADECLPGQPGLFFQGDAELNGGDGLPFGDGLRCCGGGVVRIQVVVPDANGDAATSVDVAATGGVAAGDTRCYQFWYRDPNGGPCGAGFNTSNAYSVTWRD